VRPPAATFAGGLTSVDFGVPSVERAFEQHARYVNALERCGLAVVTLDPDPRFPDSTFVEDTAILTGELAVLTRPGAPSRAGEVAAIRTAIAEYFSNVAEIEAPGTVDGGDVCEAGDRFFIGISERTNESGAVQLARFLENAGYAATTVDIRGLRSILHLKSGIAYVGNGAVVVIDDVAARIALDGYRVFRTAAAEEYAANCVRVNGAVLIAAGYPVLQRTLVAGGFETIAVEMSEFRKMDGGLSCLSLRW
jgi:dimethylargininase